jgi:uncharacterized protein
VHKRGNLRLFGSVARGEERPDSDVDLLIDLADDRGFGDYLALAEELEGALHRKVDLVLSRSLSPHFRPYIEADARPLWNPIARIWRMLVVRLDPKIADAIAAIEDYETTDAHWWTPMRFARVRHAPTPKLESSVFIGVHRWFQMTWLPW